MIAWYWVVLIGFGCFYGGMALMAVFAAASNADKAMEAMYAAGQEDEKV